MTIFIKLGGSLITDKNVHQSFRKEVVSRVAESLSRLRQKHPDLSILIGHGSGSFGHFEAHEYETVHGVSSPDQWYGFTRVAHVAAQLNRLVVDSLLSVNLSAMSIMPSSSLVVDNKSVSTMAYQNIQRCFDNGLLPVVYGDVSFDDLIGGTIASTEMIFSYLSQEIDVSHIFLLGEVDGVLDQSGKVIPHIHRGNIQQYRTALGGSQGVDVTGGMYTKVMDMLELTSKNPNLMIHIINGHYPDAIQSILSGDAIGTKITDYSD